MGDEDSTREYASQSRSAVDSLSRSAFAASETRRYDWLNSGSPSETVAPQPDLC